MAKLTICDRCKKAVNETDDRIRDFLEGEFPGSDICSDCASQVDLAGEVAKMSAITGQSPKQILESWLKIYD